MIAVRLPSSKKGKIMRITKAILICLLLSIVACSHKPIAEPREVNDYLNKVCSQKGQFLTISLNKTKGEQR